MEDAGRAIKRVREELAKKDKANGTSVSESLDLANLVKKIDRGFDGKLIHTIRGVGYVFRPDA